MKRNSGPRIRSPETGDARLDSGLRELSGHAREQAARLDALENKTAPAARKPSVMRVSRDESGGTVSGVLGALRAAGVGYVQADEEAFRQDVRNGLAELQAQVNRALEILREQGVVK